MDRQPDQDRRSADPHELTLSGLATPLLVLIFASSAAAIWVAGVQLSDDGKTVTLKLAEVKPVMQMRIKMDVKSADGAPVNTNIFTTINVVP